MLGGQSGLGTWPSQRLLPLSHITQPAAQEPLEVQMFKCWHHSHRKHVPLPQPHGTNTPFPPRGSTGSGMGQGEAARKEVPVACGGVGEEEGLRSLPLPDLHHECLRAQWGVWGAWPPTLKMLSCGAPDSSALGSYVLACRRQELGKVVVGSGPLGI